MMNVKTFSRLLTQLGILFVVSTLLFLPSPVSTQAAESTWRAGVASVVITPEKNIWMAGYASRKKPAEGKIHDLKAKALALQDGAGHRLVFVTTDLIGIPPELRQNVEDLVGQKYQLPPAGLVLNASHTHCGPELRMKKAQVQGLDPVYFALAMEYSKNLQAKIVDLIGEALSRLEPAEIGYSRGRAGFAMNRRTPNNGKFDNFPNPDGPVDHNVPVLKVTTNGKLTAVLFGYACHNTTMGFLKYYGDYAGYAQIYLEEAHPGTTALFMTGCGGDQNPYPRSQLKYAQHHGRALANGVEAALLANAKPISGELKTAYETVDLEFESIPTIDELKKMAESSGVYARRRAGYMLDQIETLGAIPQVYSYPIHVASIGNSLTMVSLAGETVVDYSIRLKNELGQHNAVWVSGYCNDVSCYIPSDRVLQEGGYEGRTAMNYSVFPSPFAPAIEGKIVDKVHLMVKKFKN